MSTSSMSSGIRDAIAAANDRFMVTYRSGDAAGMAALYTTDGQFLLPNSEAIVGRPALQQVFEGLMAAGIKEVVLDAGEIEGHGEIATEVSTYRLLGEGGQELDRGKYVVIWKREEGQWRLHRDIFNSSLPPAGQPT